MFSIDGLTWDVPCTVERAAEVKSSDISGLLLDKTWFNDVLGTYMTYTLQIAVPFGRENDWNAIYEALTAPIDGHSFTFPYNGSTVNITARVENVQDGWVRMLGDVNYWKGIRFSAVANHPTKTEALDVVLTRGRAPLPDVSSVAIGTLYEYTANGWEPSSYTDGDEIAW